MLYIPTNEKISLEWSVKKGVGNEAEDFSRATVSLFLFSDENRWTVPCTADYAGVVRAELPETLPEGVYSLDLLWVKNDKSINETRCLQRTRKTHVFAIDASTNPPAGYDDQPITIKMSTIAAPYGYDGLSAYEIAVLRGTTARSEEEWANYPGPKGDSIVKTEVMYLASEKSQGITLETAGWESSIVNPTPTKKYLWSYQTLFLDNGGVLMQNPSIVGIYGDQGVQGPIGLTPLLRYETDEVQVSYDKGNSYQRLVSITNNFRISKYVSSSSSLPTDVPEGTVYMVGPTFRADDTAQANPVYRMWVYAWKGNTLAWQDNGEFTSISAGVAQETGDSEALVMSQAVVSRELNERGEYKDNPEYIKVYTDSKGKLLWGIKANGEIEWAKGVPVPVRKFVTDLLSYKIDKEPGKILIPEQFIKEQNSEEFLHVLTDESGGVIETLMKDGSRVLAKPTNQDIKVLNATNENYVAACKLIEKVMRANYNIQFANVIRPLSLMSYLGNNQNVHPKVLYFPYKLFGYHYWMAYTPYPFSADVYENPSVAFSDDGIKWTNIDATPLAYAPTGGYNSDTHLVYREDTKVLECWYREFISGVSETIYRRCTTDGINWGAPEELHKNTAVPRLDKFLSPAIIYKDGVYHIWVVSQDGPLHIEYYTSVNGTNWVFKQNIEVDFVYNGREYSPWHIDVVYYNSQFHLLANCRYGTHWVLFLATSEDNILYNNSQVVILPQTGSWDEQLYRSSLVKVGDAMRIYYSAKTFDNKWGMGISESLSNNEFIGINYN